MKRKILIIAMALSLFFGGMAVADSVNGLFEGNPIIKLYSGGQELVATDTPAVLLNNRTMIPVYLLKKLGLKIDWNPQTYSVNVELPKPPLTDDKLNEIAKSVYELYGSKSDATKLGQGSGVVINNLLITNYHVAGESNDIEIKINGNLVKDTDVAFRNKANDLMGIRVSGVTSLKYSVELPKIGDPVIAIGFPLEKFTITKGKVTGIYVLDGRTMIVNDAFLDAGSSGGALLNADGEVIGITTVSYEGTNLSGAVPISYVQSELDKLK